jgi:hypothetical protein
MSADLLRTAATLMRERAQMATSGPWHRVAEIGIATDASSLTHATAHHPAGLYDSIPDAEHIASWHPLVALAVADWLESEADRARLAWQTARAPLDASRALAVARAYLGDRQSDSKS